MDLDGVPYLVPLALAAGALALAALIGARGLWADFAIRCRPGGRVSVRGRIPRAKVGEIKAFFARDLNPSRPIAVRGSFSPGRSLRLRFSGRMSPADRQRARNFLAAHLR